MTTSLLAAAPDFIVLAAISALILLAMLIMRNPLLPAWLQNEAIAGTISLIMTTGIFVTVVDAVPKLSDADVPYGLIVVALGGVLAGSTFVLWKVFNIGGRLARAEAGLSPFARAGAEIGGGLPVGAGTDPVP